MLKFKNKIPFIEDISLNDVIKVCQTPFYIYSQEIISQKVEKTKKILGENIFFSVKSNSNQAILKLMQSLNIGADVVSIGELKRALSAGFPPNKIIFEGVGKSKEDLVYAIQKNIRLINTESLEEIKLLQRLALEKNKALHIRKKLNIKAMKKGLKLLKGTHDFSTFRSSSCQSKSPIKTLKELH